MNTAKTTLALLLLGLGLSSAAFAIDEAIYKVSGLDSTAKTLEKLGAPKGTKLPVTFKKKGTEIKVEALPSKHLSVDFTPAHSFTITDADVFEQIETSSPKDIQDGKLLVADPATGRIFHLNRELKVTKMDILKPWPSKANLRSVKAILQDSTSATIEKSK